MKQLATALVKAQAKLHNLGKDAEGYGYKYLTLDKLINETRGVLAECGLCIVQPLGVRDGMPTVKTMLLHDSGEYIEGEYPITAVTMKQCNDAQQMGAAITYARRYGLAAILNIAQADDDAACIVPQEPVPQAAPAEAIDNHSKNQACELLVAKQEALTKDQQQWCEHQIAAGEYAMVIDQLIGM